MRKSHNSNESTGFAPNLGDSLSLILLGDFYWFPEPCRPLPPFQMGGMG